MIQTSNNKNQMGPPPAEIQSLFSSISHGYDQANNLITFGMAHRWRKSLVKWSGAKPGHQILDCATGTGDLALEFKKQVGTEGQVIGSDFCADMLKHAPQKAEQLKLQIDFQLADVTQLPFENEKFDVVSIAYGIRNVANRAQGIAEMGRVLKPGGVLMILETGDAQWPLLQKAYSLYFRHLVPRLGALATGKRSAYEYLNKSSESFPSRENFVQFISESYPFQNVEFRSLMAGASFIYKAKK